MSNTVANTVFSDMFRLILWITSFIGSDISQPPPAEEYHVTFSGDSILMDTAQSTVIPLNVNNHLRCFIEDERFYERDGLCYKLMTQGPCNSNQLFFQDDGFEDNGICDCDNNLLLYANQTDECYEPNTQGPCEAGEWFTIMDEVSPATPSCQPLPEGCLADGYHVYWESGEEGSGGGKQCWILGTQGPCSEGEVIERYITNFVGCQSTTNMSRKQDHLGNGIENGDITEEEAAERSVAMASVRSCGPGSRRSQSGKCRPIF